MLHIVFVGNPGTGKSTIANTLIGKPIFKSGVSIGRGLTSALQSYTENGVTYSDTPGLDDEHRRLRAAEEISTAVNRATSLTLIFVTSLEAGRIRPADVATVRVVLQAIEETGVNVNGRFSLIVNKCSVAELALLQQESGINVIKTAFGQERNLSDVCFISEIPELRGAKARLFPNSAQVNEFVGKAPILTISCHDVNVDAQLYSDVEKELIREKEATLDNINRLKQNKSSWWLTAATIVVAILAAPVGAAAVALAASGGDDED